jgi:ribosomal protein S18 acetylase RimI-like enzyme
MHLAFRDAVADDGPTLLTLVRRAYRGDESRGGWTTEADLLADERIDLPQLLTKITAPDSMVLVAEDKATGEAVACCELARREGGLAYFGMFAVRPDLQAAGIGRRMLAEAERIAGERWQCSRMEMTVIGQRPELIAWYERRGYTCTAERRPFPYEQLINGVALRDDLYFSVLVKDLVTAPVS